ncbi:MAG: hypothetical protein IJR80_02550 [Treponema sp.]|nr:hypothetical protein [Treponema sp.]
MMKRKLFLGNSYKKAGLLALVICLFSVFIAVSCSTMKVEGFKTSIWDEDAKVTDYKVIFVRGDFPDLAFRERFENSLVKYLTENNKDPISSYRIMPPLKTYTKDEEDEVIKKYKIDCIIAVSINEEGMNHNAISKSSTIGSNVATYNPYVRLGSGVSSSSTTTTTSVNTPIGIEVIECKTNKTVMRGLTNFYDVYTNYDLLARSVRNMVLTREYDESYKLLKEKIYALDNDIYIEEGEKFDTVNLRKPTKLNVANSTLVIKICSIRCNEEGLNIRFAYKVPRDSRNFLRHHSESSGEYYDCTILSETDVDYVADLIEQGYEIKNK